MRCIFLVLGLCLSLILFAPRTGRAEELSEEVRAGLTQAYSRLEAGQMGEAEGIYRSLLQSHPNLVQAWFGLGLIHERLDRLEDAAQDFREVLSRDKSNALAHNNLGWIESRRGRHDAALEHLLQALFIDPDYRLAKINLGLVYLDLQQPDKALTVFDALLLDTPQDDVLLINRAVALVRLGRPQEARRILTNVLTRTPDSIEGRINLALVDIAQSRLPAARAGLEALLQTPQLPKAARLVASQNLGWVLSHMGESARARMLWLDVLKIDPNYLPALDSLATLAMREQRPQEAIELYNRMLGLRPADGTFLLDRGAARFMNGEYAAALRDYEEALAREPGLWAAHLGAGLTLQKLGRHADAIVSFNSALELHPRSMEAYVGMARAHLAVGRLADARAALESAIKLQPKSGEPRLLMGDLLARNGKWSAALPHYRIAAWDRVTGPAGWLGIARSELRLGHREAARKAVVEAVRRDDTLRQQLMNDAQLRPLLP